MVFYIEFVVLDNIVMDYLIFYLMGFTCKYKFKKIRLFIACILGVLCAFFMPYLISLRWLLIMYKIVFSIVIVLSLRQYKKLKTFVFYLGIFWLYTFVLGGVILGMLNLFSINYSLNGVFMYNFELPISILLILAVVMVWLLKNVIKAIRVQLQTSNYMYKIKLIDGDNSVVATGFLDSGNNVQKGSSGVNIISFEVFQKLHKEISIDKIIMRKVDKNCLKDLSYINISGLSGNDKFLSFTIDKMIIENKVFENVVVAVMLKEFENFDCILSNNYVGVFNEKVNVKN